MYLPVTRLLANVAAPHSDHSRDGVHGLIIRAAKRAKWPRVIAPTASPARRHSRSPHARSKPKFSVAVVAVAAVAGVAAVAVAEYDRLAALVFPWPGPSNPQQGHVGTICTK